MRIRLLIGSVILLVASVIAFIASTGSSGLSADESAALGKALFHDKRLGADGKTSCASCHDPGKAFSDGRALALGVHDQHGTRNTPSLTAMVTSRRTTFFWDGRRSRLEDAVMDPFSNPVEMGLADRATVSQRVHGLPEYERWFPRESRPSLSETDQVISQALATYLRTLSALPTRFERFTQGDANAISAREKIGLAIFQGKGQCATCHIPESGRLSDNLFHRSGVTMDDIAIRLPELTRKVLERNLAGEALGSRIATHHDEAQLGRFLVIQHPDDIEKFGTPSLRNVRLTAPYMHDGSVATLDDAIDREVYYRGLDTGYPIGLTAQERSDLRAFLEAL